MIYFINLRLGLVLAVSFVVAFNQSALADAEPTAASGYHVLSKIPLEGAGAGDYLTLDVESRRLYVTHKDMVHVLDADSLKLIGTIKGTTHAHGIVVLDKLGKGFITSGEPGSVVVFDLKTLKHLAEIASSPDTDGITYDPASDRVITFNGDSKNATIIDPNTNKVVKILALGGSPEAAVPDREGQLFDNLKDKSQVIKIGTTAFDIEKRWSLAPGQSPSGIALDLKQHRLFVGCRNSLLVVMDSENGKLIQTLPIGAHVDATVFDPASGTIFNSCGDGTLSIIHEDSPDKFHVVENVRTEEGAKTMAFDPQSDQVFLSTARFEISNSASKDLPKTGRKVVAGSFHVLVMAK